MCIRDRFWLDQTVLNIFYLTHLIKRMLTSRFTFTVGNKAIGKFLAIIRQYLG